MSIEDRAREIIANGCSCDRHCEQAGDGCGCRDDARTIIDMVNGSKKSVVEPTLNVSWVVIADDEWYGENRSKTCKDGAEAIAYARSLPKTYRVEVHRRITMVPIFLPVQWQEVPQE